MIFNKSDYQNPTKEKITAYLNNKTDVPLKELVTHLRQDNPSITDGEIHQCLIDLDLGDKNLDPFEIKFHGRTKNELLEMHGLKNREETDVRKQEFLKEVHRIKIRA